MKAKPIIIWTLRFISAGILLQTLYFKFTGHPQSMYIFRILDLEPYGRIGIGILELIASVLILFPKTSLFGTILAVGLMLGAVGSHLGKLGISIMNDGGYLFFLALTVLICSILLILLDKNKLILLIKNILNGHK